MANSRMRQHDAARAEVLTPAPERFTREVEPLTDEQLRSLAGLMFDGASDDLLEYLRELVHEEQHRRHPQRHLYHVRKGNDEYPSLCARVWVSAFETTEAVSRRPLLGKNDCASCVEYAIEYDVRIVRRADFRVTLGG